MATETPSKFDFWSALRMILCAVGGAIAGNSGIGVSENEIQGLVGAFISIAMIVWGVYVRWNARSVPLEVAVQPNIPVQSSLTGQVVTGPGVPT